MAQWYKASRPSLRWHPWQTHRVGCRLAERYSMNSAKSAPRLVTAGCTNQTWKGRAPQTARLNPSAHKGVVVRLEIAIQPKRPLTQAGCK
ncbi:Uncharacterised protein [Vibrio cholerae]|nr:Uncharacterised protein [Vibrio cholerae]CSD00460.1 Uncharacterised protein [Vibrio cholerae]CSI59558.1 Uncharacterised protein [Vibrio cholerae]